MFAIHVTFNMKRRLFLTKIGKKILLESITLTLELGIC